MEEGEARILNANTIMACENTMRELVHARNDENTENPIGEWHVEGNARLDGEDERCRLPDTPRENVNERLEEVHADENHPGYSNEVNDGRAIRPAPPRAKPVHDA